jgi:hypothetical protein
MREGLRITFSYFIPVSPALLPLIQKEAGLNILTDYPDFPVKQGGIL